MTDTILVTGGSGKLGRVVISELKQHGYHVINADQHQTEGVYTIKTDLCDLGQVYSVASQASAIVHLAAIPTPTGYPPDVVFKNNAMSTFNILQAASDLGINNVVIASSLSALGLAYKSHPIKLHYLPIDEAHPALAQDAYGISKIVGEDIADGFARLNPNMSVLNLRLPLLANPGEIQEALHKQSSGHIAQGELILWSYLDTRDAAIVVRQAVEYKVPGHEILYVNAAETYSDKPTIALIKQHFPNVDYDEERLSGHLSPIDCSRAREILNFQPQFDWQTAKDKD